MRRLLLCSLMAALASACATEIKPDLGDRSLPAIGGSVGAATELAPDTRGVLECIAVAGGPVPVAVVHDVIGDDPNLPPPLTP